MGGIKPPRAFVRFQRPETVGPNAGHGELQQCRTYAPALKTGVHKELLHLPAVNAHKAPQHPVVQDEGAG